MTPPTSRKDLPRISIVTPSFNHAAFLEETIRSVLDQNYPNLEYVIIDGGSSDGSVEIIRKYESRLAFWVSEPDKGQYDAINKGFSHTTGDIMAWLNSDDKYLPWTFTTIADLFSQFPQIEWLTSVFHCFWDGRGRFVRCEAHDGFSRTLVIKGGALPGCGWYAPAFVQQESTFWRRSVWNKTGATIDVSYSLAADFDFWMRLAREAELYCVEVPLAGFRRHKSQKTANHMTEYLRQARESFVARGGRPAGMLKNFWLKKSAKLLRYLNRRHAIACAQQGNRNRAVLNADTGRWELTG
ncbi:MAG TPA: glycosyltransferase family 2 protein [Candidatus Limnocylindrales bacterium]|nr:glycosyltransferase family 2 protein [Candidatus Limnocylindrales bacterium]